VSDTPPSAHELELSVFGPGTGECVVVHLGDGDWIVIDSCIERESGTAVALSYLRELGVPVEKSVRLVVATHWHDDHIGGLGELFETARTAKFVNSAAHPLKNLVRLVTLGAKTGPASSATVEFHKVTEVLEARRHQGEKRDSVGPVPALANNK